MRVRWLRRAERSLEVIADRIAKDNPRAAHQTILTIRAAAEKLVDQPSIGRLGRVLGTRELVVIGSPYILPYRVKDDEVQILHVIHGARRWPQRF